MMANPNVLFVFEDYDDLRQDEIRNWDSPYWRGIRQRVERNTIGPKNNPNYTSDFNRIRANSFEEFADGIDLAFGIEMYDVDFVLVEAKASYSSPERRKLIEGLIDSGDLDGLLKNRTRERIRKVRQATDKPIILISNHPEMLDDLKVSGVEIAYSESPLYHDPFSISQAIKRFNKRERRESLRTQLSQLVEDLDESDLENIVTSMDSDLTNFEDNRLTNNGHVLRYRINGKIAYLKPVNKSNTAKLTKLKREATYLTQRRQIPMLRAITPEPIGYIEEGNVCALLTYGTENKGVVSAEDKQAYDGVFNRWMLKAAEELGVAPNILMGNNEVIDTFNRALEHTYMKDFKGEPLYSQGKRELILPFDALLDRASATEDKGLFEFLRSLEPWYNELESQYEPFESEYDETVVGFDVIAENIFKSGLGEYVRPSGDFEKAQVGSSVIDLSKQETKNAYAKILLYAYFRNNLEQERGNNFEYTPSDVRHMTENVRVLTPLNLTRVLSHKLSMNDIENALKYAGFVQNLLRQNYEQN